MLTAKGITKAYNQKSLLSNVDFILKSSEIVGLVGDNGSGKTTLLKILYGEISPDEGAINRSQATIGYLPQFQDFGTSTVSEHLLQHIDSPYEEYKIDVALSTVNLSVSQEELCSNLSGGQKTKLGLARLLLLNPYPNVLLLDEPTNNLDLEGLEYLSDFVNSFKGSVVIVSHDRKLLDTGVSRICEISQGNLIKYGGNYSEYRLQKLREEQRAQKEYKENKREISRIEKLLKSKKDRITSLSNQKRRDSDKYAHTFLKERATKKSSKDKGSLESKLNQLEVVDKPKTLKSYKYGFSGKSHKGKLLLAIRNISKSFGGPDLFRGLENDIEIRAGDNVWFVGINGSGKTTLLKILAGRLEPDEGTIEYGNNVTIGYFSQDILDEDIDSTPLEVLQQACSDLTKCYNAAKKIHLEESALKNSMRSLSRGQQVKVQFLRLILGDYQLLLLDEPTNHLEISTREEIELALRTYSGTIAAASHDRYFIESLSFSKRISL